MSLRLLAVLPHRLDSFEDVAELPTLLTRLASLDQAIDDAYSRDCIRSIPAGPAGWSIRSSDGPPAKMWSENGWLSYRTASEAFIDVGRHCLVAFTVAKWYYARGHPDLLAAAQRFFHALANELGAPGFLVYHDAGTSVQHWVYSGMTLEQIRSEIVATGARPVASLDDLLWTEAQLESADYGPDVFYEEVCAAGE